MIPSVLARHLRQGVNDFLRTTFPISTPFFHGMIDRLLREDGAVFKGPWLDLQLPFRQGEGSADYFPGIPLPFNPYLHQEKAFKRITSPDTRSTLIATGTGSGKTECFLYPILDHCYRHRGEPGIKAILVYPMNALASDQAERLAAIIWKNTNIRGYVSAGLFVGQKDNDPRMTMGPDHIITNKSTMRLAPPDILLTNYKMLDYLLIRPMDHRIWGENAPETLKYLVVDELHTFDGAQGTDLACLIRRLKERLGTPAGYLCCVGTSATMGDREHSETLKHYASLIFGESFDEDCVITESRLSAGEFLENCLIARIEVVPPEKAPQLNPENYAGYAQYVKAQYELWVGTALTDEQFAGKEWRFALASWLKEHFFFHNLLKALGGKILEYGEILQKLERVTPGFSQDDCAYGQHLLESLLSLISEARLPRKETPEEKTLRELEGMPPPADPFLHVRLQVWMRELRRMVAEVKPAPALRFADDMNEEQMKNMLPVVHCRECGSLGWAGIKRSHESKIIPDLIPFYMSFFRYDPKVVFIFPDDVAEERQRPLSLDYLLCPFCLHIQLHEEIDRCPKCSRPGQMKVFIPVTVVTRNNRKYGTHNCPYCNGYNSLTIVGSQAASLTSVLIQQLFSSSFNNDKKLLTFSDSVQDAAHRSGFFQARTYRFNFRIALQQFVMSGGSGRTLEELPGLFKEYWLKRMERPRFISTFIAPDMEWRQDFNFLKNHGSLPVDSSLGEEVGQRIAWEIFNEYGFSSRIGRTLEKTGSSIVYLDETLLKRLVSDLQEIVRNEIGELRTITEEPLSRLIAGMVSHLKSQGGIMFPALDCYIESVGNSYLISRIPWMPPFGKNSRAPAFLTTKPGERFDLLLAQTRASHTWYQAWALKCLTPVSLMITDLIEALYEIVLNGMVRGGVMEERSIRGARVWGIKSGALRVSKDVIQLRCSRCGHTTSVAGQEREIWEGAPCLRFRCEGIYHVEPDRERDYYAILYATGDIERIVAEEHTGLLKREARENLEARFKSLSRNPWDPNLLSCTPTLEMGIDIGELSSVILCSVPPSQARYLQRIGRAGRRDGNSLNVTVAAGKPHDLYFYHDPCRMISGEVASPGVFLNASAVLERQLVAFCFDSWVMAESSEHMIPWRLGLALDNLSHQKAGKFPFNFTAFIESHQTELYSRFISIFSDTLSEESKTHLKTFIEGEHEGSLRFRIMDGLHSLSKQRESLRKKVKLLTDRIRRKKESKVQDRNFDEDLREMTLEKQALRDLITSISDRNTFNYFTDEGLIPNYAFPEAGVMLRSVIFRKKEHVQEGESWYETEVFDYERPAVSAIEELAPSSRFYAGGRRVRVDQIDMTVSDIEIWRFCDRCSYMELTGIGDEKKYCPRCGSVMWGDSGQKRQMIRMRQVFATTPDRKSRISDDSDEREPSFYNKQMIVNFDEHAITDAYTIESEEYPFGFEFLSKVSFREINFGERVEMGDKVVIGGRELQRKGFQICRICGKVQGNDDAIQHARTCTARDQDSEKNLMDCVYLYREFSSEAMRILLPVTTFAASNQVLHSFIAALNLGLRKLFGGSIDHLRTTEYDEPVPDTSYRKKYLILYDTVPGGTGYLKQLMCSPHPLLDLLELARAELLACPCNQEQDSDGCYSCLYAYRNSHDMRETSRDTAVELFNHILKNRDKLKKIDTLEHIQVNSLFDSELEARFIEALRQSSSEDTPVTLSKELVNEKPGYFFKIKDQAYYIEPQVTLDDHDGVRIPSKIDFLFRPARATSSVKPVALFTDGYLYHKDRIGKDLLQRMAIAQSGKFHVWSITWKDVDNRFHKLDDFYRNYTDAGEYPGGSHFKMLLDGYGLDHFKSLHTMDNFALLVRFLADPMENDWQNYAFVSGLTHIDARRFLSESAMSEWAEKCREHIPPAWNWMPQVKSAEYLYGLYEPGEYESGPSLRLFVSVKKSSLKPIQAEGMNVTCCLCDSPVNIAKVEFEKIWNGWLRLYNIYQFLPSAFFVTTRKEDESLYGLLSPWHEMAEDEIENPGWEEVRGLIDQELVYLASTLASGGCPPPEPGYELTDSRGEIIATAEMGWPEQKIAFLSQDEMEEASLFEHALWKVYPLNEAVGNPEKFAPMFQVKTI